MLTPDEERTLIERLAALPLAPVEFRGFGATVLGVSPGSAARMRFKKVSGPGGAVDRASIVLEPRSGYAMTGPARSVWQHSIPAVETLRYSITFRSVR